MPTVSCYLSREKARRLKERAERRGVKPYRIMKEVLEAALGDDIEQRGEELRNEEGTRRGVSGTEEADWRKFLKPDEGNPKPRRGK